jgi:hypothetical protein
MSTYGNQRKMTMFEIPAHVRKWIYGIIAATVPLLITVGSITGDMGQQILSVAAAILAVGGSALAIKNVPDED